MNDTNDAGNPKRAARDRLAVERQRLRTRHRRRRALVTGTAVIGVLGLAAVAGVLAANADGSRNDSEGPVVAPAGATGKDRLAIPVGRPDAPSTLTVWEDFRCPACQQFERQYRPVLQELTEQGRIRVEYRLVTLIDDNMGGSGSRRAANAAACAQQSGTFSRYHDVLYDHQPEETKDEYADNATLIRLARKVPGLVTDAFENCVRGGTYDNWVVKSNQLFRDRKLSGTPTVLLNGDNLLDDPGHPLTPDRLRSLVEQADAA